MGFLSSGKPPKPLPQPAPADTNKAMLNALAYAEVERKMRRTSGRAGNFLPMQPTGKNLLGA